MCFSFFILGVGVCKGFSFCVVMGVLFWAVKWVKLVLQIGVLCVIIIQI